MGFFGAMGKILAGKPVYTPEDIAQQQGAASQSLAPPTSSVMPPQSTGPKVIPQLHCGRVESRVEGNRLDIYLDLENASNDEVFVDRLAVLGQHRQVDRELRPGERHQILVYSGGPLTAAPQGYLEVQYRKQVDGDYFKSFYQIRFERHAHGFEVTEFHPAGPVKDI